MLLRLLVARNSCGQTQAQHRRAYTRNKNTNDNNKKKRLTKKKHPQIRQGKKSQKTKVKKQSNKQIKQTRKKIKEKKNFSNTKKSNPKLKRKTKQNFFANRYIPTHTYTHVFDTQIKKKVL